MRLGDVIVYNKIEGIVSFIEDNYVECVKNKKYKNFEIDENDWFSFFFVVIEKGLNTLYFGADEPIEDEDEGDQVLIITNSSTSFISNESRVLKEGKIFSRNTS